MALLFLLLMLVLNFAISWANASYVGRYWSESKELGGSFRVEVIIGYIMAIAGFTMVYGYILLLLAPIILTIAGVDEEIIISLEQLSADLIYLFTVLTIIPTGVYIWLKSLKNFWENRTWINGLSAGWNTYAQVHNTISAARNAPSAIGRVASALFGGKGKKKDDAAVIACAILILIVAICGGYFTASAIMKKADREYDMFKEISQKKEKEYYG